MNSKSASDLSEDLFKVHDFDVKIDLQVPSSGRCSSRVWECDCPAHYGTAHFFQSSSFKSIRELLKMGAGSSCL